MGAIAIPVARARSIHGAKSINKTGAVETAATMAKGLLAELFGSGSSWDTLTQEQKRLYRTTWKHRNPEKEHPEYQARRDRANAKHRLRRQTDPVYTEKQRAYYREWVANNRHLLPKHYRRYRLKVEYGLTIDQFDAMVASQANRCAICGDPPTKKRDGKLSVDHDHSTGRVRQLLCHNCNMVLGHARDSAAILQKAIEYLKRHDVEAA